MLENKKVEDLMIKTVIFAEKKSTLKEIKNIFVENKIHHIPVLDNGVLSGIVSSNDIHAAEIVDTKIGETFAHTENIKAEDFMQKEIVSIYKDATIVDALKYFLEAKVHSLPVVSKDGKLEGIITTYDIIKYLIRNMSK